MKRDLFQIGIWQKWFFTIRFYSDVGGHPAHWIRCRPLGGPRFAIDVLWIGFVFEQYPG